MLLFARYFIFKFLHSLCSQLRSALRIVDYFETSSECRYKPVKGLGTTTLNISSRRRARKVPSKSTPVGTKPTYLFNQEFYECANI